MTILKTHGLQKLVELTSQNTTSNSLNDSIILLDANAETLWSLKN